MAVVCKTARQAEALCGAADNALSEYDLNPAKRPSIRLDTAEFGEEDDAVKIVGILTLENIIERVLQTDIHDEKDYEHKMSGTLNQPSMLYKSHSEYSVSNISDLKMAPSQISQEDHPVFRSRFINRYYN